VVLLRVTDQGGRFDTDQATITVTSGGNTAPTAVAGANPTTGQAPLAVTFSSAGSTDPDAGQTLSYAWDFQDGSTSTEPNPTHTFTTAGAYDVLLTVTDNAATPASGFAIVSIDVRGNNPPDVSTASANPLFGPVPLTVHFDASSVTDPDGNNVTVEWDFGDGSATSSAVTVDHVYPNVGAVTAHLTATDDFSTPASATRSFVINPGGGPILNQAPDCTAATVTPLQGSAPLMVTLDATGCTDPEGNGMTYLWRIQTSLTTEDQIDTATGYYEFTEDSWTQDGVVTITLRVTDDAAQPMSTSREFVVTVGAGGGGYELKGVVCMAGATGPGAPGVAALMAAGLALGLRRRRR
jgi:MYXO-CTERM domain-containing protein